MRNAVRPLITGNRFSKAGYRLVLGNPSSKAGMGLATGNRLSKAVCTVAKPEAIFERHV